MPQQEARFARLGEQITRLIRSVAAVKGWKMTHTMEYIGELTYYGTDMIHRWRQGKVRPASEVIETLARIGKEDANLSREWGESLLRNAQHTDALNIINKLWGPKDVHTIPCNLRTLERTHLIGRKAEVTRLLELLSPHQAAPLITIDGIGGVGKTALVLEAAYRCWKASTGEDFTSDTQIPIFDAIIFVSAKQQYLTPDGILISGDAKRTLRDIFRAIASILGSEITRTTPQDQILLVKEVLSRQRTLLIVDNLETMEDKQEIMSFLYDLPSSVKVVITTRERVLFFSPIRLDQLAQDAAIHLIEEEAQEKGADINRELALNLYQRIGGIPVALIYAVGQIASGFSLETVLNKIPRVKSDIAQFCFEGSIDPLRGKKEHKLLMAIAIFPKSPVRTAIAAASGLTGDPIAVEEGLAQLQKLSLLRIHHTHYEILPLTREYALSELATHPQFEQEARSRWVKWYLDFTKEYAGKDWKEWYIRYDHIEDEWENLLAVFDWCAAHEEYTIVQTLWQERYLVKFAHIYGYWDDRLIWLDWLIQAGKKRGDWSNAIRAMVDKASTLTLLGQLEEAEEQLKQAWHKYKYATPWVQLILIAKTAHLCIYQEHYLDAISWLDQGRDLLHNVQFEEPERTRRWIDLQTYRGLAYYKQGDYTQAKRCYQDVRELSQAINWQRMIILAWLYLAYIAIAQDQFNEAELLLEAGLPVIDNNTDKRLSALYRQAFAQIYKSKRKVFEAQIWSKEALNGFEYLGMKAEAEETREMLHSLQEEQPG